MSRIIRSSGHLRWFMSVIGGWTDIWPTHSAKFISFDLFRFLPTESSFVDKIGEFLLHEILDFRDCLLQASLGCACHV